MASMISVASSSKRIGLVAFVVLIGASLAQRAPVHAAGGVANVDYNLNNRQSPDHVKEIILNMNKVMGPTRLDSLPRVSAVQGSSVNLPCNITPPAINDKVRLVLFFRNHSDIPIYTYDIRGQGHIDARHWSDENILAGRAFFRGDKSPARLILDNVKPSDAGLYRCRADFYKSPTTIETMILDVIVPPGKPTIYDERGQEVQLKLGPYTVGENVLLKCVSFGGHPSPQLTWWRDHALLDDSVDKVDETGTKVVNELRLADLQRSDLHAILTCQASNNNISMPSSTSVKLDMHFGPLEVRMIGRKDPVSAGRVYEFRDGEKKSILWQTTQWNLCQSVGARPPPQITWWRGSTQLRENVTNKTSPDGNVTLSLLNYVPSVRDGGKYMSCRAENPELPESSMEDGWKLEILYVPQSVLSLGTSLNASNIKEGDDVYFECNVRANPKPYKITWKFNEHPLTHNIHTGIIISNQSLVLQNVKRQQSGIYTCVAHNIEGDGVSNPVTLNIRYAPFCKPNQVQVFGVARDEMIRVTCEVEANPIGSTVFEWKFNASGDLVDIPNDRFDTIGTTSVVEYIPRTELDYGSLICRAHNSIGRQSEPCVFNLIPAGTPDAVKNCSFGNQTPNSLEVRCYGGYDGGLPQSYILEAKDNQNFATVSKIQNKREPHFNVTGLQPGRSYVLTVYSQNAKGPSAPVTLYSFTIKESDHQPHGSAHPANVTRDGVSVTPVLGILVAVGCGLALVAVAIIVVLRIRPSSRSYSSGHRQFKSSGPGVFSGNPGPNMTHVALDQREVDQLMGPERMTPEPDLITNHKVYQPEEHENFANFQEMQRQMSAGGMINPTMTSSVTLQRRKTDDDTDGRKKLKNNFSRLSQEVTYAEFTMPRNKGYAPMKARSSDSPVNASPSLPREKPAPPPRYTSTPTSFMRSLSSSSDRQMSVEMPLVSTSSRGGRKSSSDSNRTVSPQQETGIKRDRVIVQAPLHKQLSMIHDEEDCFESGGFGSHRASSLPDDICEQGEDPMERDKFNRMSAREKRRVMMAKMRDYKTQSNLIEPLSSKPLDVPQELLERRRVLMKTLNRVQSQQNQWSSLPSSPVQGKGSPSQFQFNESTESNACRPLEDSKPAMKRPLPPSGRKLTRCNSAAIVPNPNAVTRRQLPQVPNHQRRTGFGGHPPLLKQRSMIVSMSAGDQTPRNRILPSRGSELATIHSSSMDSEESYFCNDHDQATSGVLSSLTSSQFLRRNEDCDTFRKMMKSNDI